MQYEKAFVLGDDRNIFPLELDSEGNIKNITRFEVIKLLITLYNRGSRSVVIGFYTDEFKDYEKELSYTPNRHPKHHWRDIEQIINDLTSHYPGNLEIDLLIGMSYTTLEYNESKKED